MEFMQFHPTAFYCSENPALLVTEALRGAGAYLRDIHGERFMLGIHPQAELAPRDVVVRRMKEVMDRDQVDHVLLDARHLACVDLRDKFPTVTQGLRARGVDLCTQLVPVSPASHYFMGGVITDLWGRTSLPGLWACGEVASTGVHGANRLASNSMLEALVCAWNMARRLHGEGRPARASRPAIPAWRSGSAVPSDEAIVVAHNWNEVRTCMWDYVGIVRSNKRLERAWRRIRMLRAEIRQYYLDHLVTADVLELRNLAAVAELIVRSARRRRESRGLHYTLDYPHPDDRRGVRDTIIRDPPGEHIGRRRAATGEP